MATGHGRARPEWWSRLSAALVCVAVAATAAVGLQERSGGAEAGTRVTASATGRLGADPGTVVEPTVVVDEVDRWLRETAVREYLEAVAVEEYLTVQAYLQAVATRPRAVKSYSSPGLSIDREAIKEWARGLLASRGWGDQWTCLDRLVMKESGWNPRADNPRSSAYGIPQALPGRKMASHGADWATNPQTQVRWMLDYIAARYGTPCGAWGHSQRTGWY